MLLPELQSLAASLGISGTARMRKGELVTAIQERQAGESRPTARAAVATANTANASVATATEAPAEVERVRSPRRATRAAGPPEPRTTADQGEAAPSGAALEGGTTVVDRPERTERTE